MDRYNLTARIYPMVIFALPLGVFLIVGIWDFQKYYHVGIPIGVLGVFAYLAANLGRDAGKRKEPKLWAGWGGAPSTQLFRWRNDTLDRLTKSRNHEKMQQLCPADYQVDEVFESNNEALADEVYKAWTKFVIGKTRDTSKYPLIFRENISYGFRRNLWGLKPFAILLIILLSGATYVYFGYILDSWRLAEFPPVFAVVQSILFLFLVFWIAVVNKKWVSIPANAYAERLHEAIETLQ